MQLVRFVLFVAAAASAAAQTPSVPPVPAQPAWQMQESGTTASLRGIDSVDGKIAWASGSGGTVLRTIDGGAHWQNCAIPDGDKDGATLDFRGVQAWDAQTAIVMASGPGDKSRLYKTIDGCKSWTLLLKNLDKDGFWDALVHPRETYGDTKIPDYTLLLGDPIHGQFDIRDGTNPVGKIPDVWEKSLAHCAAKDGEAVFAASNSSVVVSAFESFIIATGGKSGAHVLLSPLQHRMGDYKTAPCLSVEVPIAGGSDSSGIFSIGFANSGTAWRGVAVGGDYKKPDEAKGTSAWTIDGARHWTASTTPPHGYRSTVQWGESIKAWITAGTNGSDVSHDDGKTWQPLDNGNWNALSLPFIVGPKGRIARLNPAALPNPSVP
jgi:photosystem II stability/assembly factor-like uncharacterized protein